MKIEVAADLACTLGENPLWHRQQRRLYWIDIKPGRLYWYDPATGRHDLCYEGPMIGGFTIQADGSLLLFRAGGNIVQWRDGKVVRTIVEAIPEQQQRGARFNDVFADPAGRVFCGTLSMNERNRAPAALYRLALDGSISKVADGFTLCNGMGFTPDRRQMYFTDTLAYTIYLFDYDAADGSLSNRRVWTTTLAKDGLPDGLTVDARGHIWSARWDGHAVIHLSPEGEEVDRIVTTSKKVTSVTFGGDDCRDMYLTTAGGEDREANGPTAGALLRVVGAGQGVPEFSSRVGL